MHHEAYENLGYNKGYLYAHDFEHNFALQEYLPDTSVKYFITGKIQEKKNSEDPEGKMEKQIWILK